MMPIQIFNMPPELKRIRVYPELANGATVVATGGFGSWGTVKEFIAANAIASDFTLENVHIVDVDGAKSTRCGIFIGPSLATLVAEVSVYTQSSYRRSRYYSLGGKKIPAKTRVGVAVRNFAVTTAYNWYVYLHIGVTR